MKSQFRIIPLELKNANSLVALWHRHHKPVQGHRFSIGAVTINSDKLVGAAIVGRPVARLTDFTQTVEVTRLVTNGTKNACSFLYGACARIAKEMGYSRIQTFILDSETGISLIAAGWLEQKGKFGGGQWKHTDGKRRRTDQPISPKRLFYKILNPPFEKPPIKPIDNQPILL